MTLEALNKKLDNTNEAIYELIYAINETNNQIITYVIVIACVLILATIITECCLIKYLKKSNKQIEMQNQEIKDIQEYLSFYQKNSNLSKDDYELIQLLKNNPQEREKLLNNLKKD